MCFDSSCFKCLWYHEQNATYHLGYQLIPLFTMLFKISRTWAATSPYSNYPTSQLAQIGRKICWEHCALLSQHAQRRESAQLWACQRILHCVTREPWFGTACLSGYENHICFVQKACLQCTNPGSCKIPTAARKGTVSSAAGDCLISL